MGVRTSEAYYLESRLGPPLISGNSHICVIQNSKIARQRSRMVVLQMAVMLA